MAPAEIRERIKDEPALSEAYERLAHGLARGDKCVVEMEYGMDVGTHMGAVDPAPEGAEAGGRRTPRILRR